MGVLAAFMKGIEDIALRIKGSLSVRICVRRMKNGSEDVFSPSRFIFSSSKPLRVSILSSAVCKSLQRGKRCCSVGSAAEVCRGRCEAGGCLSGAGGARCSGSVTFWAEVYVPLGTRLCLKRRRRPVLRKK